MSNDHEDRAKALVHYVSHGWSIELDKGARHGLEKAVAAALAEAEKKWSDAEDEIMRLIKQYDDQNEYIEKLQAEVATLREQVAKLEAKFPCGHRKVDFDDSYGGCALDPVYEMARDYDRLPMEIIECHDKITELESQLAAARVEGLRSASKYAQESIDLALCMHAGEHARVAATIKDRIEAEIAALERGKTEELMSETVKENLNRLYQVIWCEARYDPTNDDCQELAEKLLPYIKALNDELHFKV